VDISDTLERKIASIKCFETQFPASKHQLFTRIESMARFLGSTAGVEAAEMLISPRPVVTRDLMVALFE
jgi:LmbE family N-acetylglucosaminyl deacetylase